MKTQSQLIKEFIKQQVAKQIKEATEKKSIDKTVSPKMMAEFGRVYSKVKGDLLKRGYTKEEIATFVVNGDLLKQGFTKEEIATLVAKWVNK